MIKAQFKIQITWDGEVGPGQTVKELVVQQSRGSSDNIRFLKGTIEKHQSRSVAGEENVNGIIAGYGLVHKQSMDGWMHFVRPETIDGDS